MNITRAIFRTKAVDGALLVIDGDGSVSVTNDAEAVVLACLPLLKSPADRILYKDTDGRWDELRHDGARFVGFAPITGADRQTHHLA